jgi:hypothetical protein
VNSQKTRDPCEKAVFKDVSDITSGNASSHTNESEPIGKCQLVPLPLPCKGAPTLYFDPQLKTKKKDLFDREAELKRFFHPLSYSSLIVITGLRRSGKTSLARGANSIISSIC